MTAFGYILCPIVLCTVQGEYSPSFQLLAPLEFLALLLVGMVDVLNSLDNPNE